MPDDIQQRVLRAFQQEHREHIGALRDVLADWPNLSLHALEEAFRLAHSLKGGARVCGLGVIEKLTHYIEQIFADLMHGRKPPSAAMREEILDVLAAVEDYMSALAAGETPTPPAELFARFKLELPAEPVAQPSSQPSTTPGSDTPPAPQLEAKATGDFVRLSARNLDRLLRSASELLSSARKQNDTSARLAEINREVDRLFRGSEQGALPPEEIRSGLLRLGRLSRRLLNDQREDAHGLQLLAERLQNDVRVARMVPVSSVFEGFGTMVRDIARSEGKEVEFSARGMESEADRLVLQTLKDPVMHALRNAVSHGIESTEQRVRLGKPAAGHIELHIVVEGNRLIVCISDDGRGIDLQAVKDRAIQLGMSSPEDARDLTAEETHAFLFRPGFSTRTQVTTIAGRGIGLSAVRETAARLQGTASFSPTRDAGSELVIDVPVTAATHRVLLVRAEDSLYAIPTTAVASLHRVSGTEVKLLEGKAHIWIDQSPVLLATLGGALGGTGAPLTSSGGKVNVVLLKSGSRRLALGVDALSREMNSMVMPLPEPAARSPYFSGGIALEDGQVILVINPGAVFEGFKGGTLEHREAPAAESRARRPAVLVVDDSFTARTLQKNILETAGYDVKIAVDGAQALASLKASTFDAVVADVQMPRMDGFQLLEAMKTEERLRSIPVILVTSLSSEEDQARGMSLGARAYIVKQRFDHKELLEVVRQIL